MSTKSFMLQLILLGCTVILTVLGLGYYNSLRLSEDPKFNAEELAYIKDHPVISVGILKDHPPITFEDQNGPGGISYDYLKLVEQNSGLQFKEELSGDVVTLIAAMKTCAVHVLPGFRATGDRSNFMMFSVPFVTVHTAIIRKRGDASEFTQIGAANGYAVLDALHGKDYKVTTFANNKEVLAGVLAGTVPAGIMTVPSANWEIKVSDFSPDLFELHNVDWEHYFSMGTCKDDRVLTSIIDKALTIVPAKVQADLIKKWKIS
jgi:ABC-type amino acid transport substrate-binding protein